MEAPIAIPAQAEADRASTAFHAALTQIGAQTVEDALALWNEVPVNARPETSRAWLRAAVSLVMTRRARARDLATAYYRLVRALHTGSTIPDPKDPVPTSVSLSTLRREFASLADAERPSEAPPASTPQAAPEAASEAATPVDEPSEDDEADRIAIEEIARLREEEDRLAREAEVEARIALEALGPSNLARIVDAIDTEQPASEVDATRKGAHLKAGARQAAAAARVAMDGGRGTVWSYASRDQRAIGYVRLSRTGTPCGWCAMLISRGPVYRSEASATYAEGDLYHDNCNCYAMPVFTREQYDESEMFRLNRLYAEQWPRVTKGLTGKAALTAWRRFIRTEQAAARSRSTTTSVQEA